MAKFTLQTHDNRKTKAGTVNTVAANPYVRLAADGQVFFLQNGKFWSEGGQEQKNVPAWVVQQADALDETVKRECGWGVQNLDDARVRQPGARPSEIADLDHPLTAEDGVAGNPSDDQKAQAADPKAKPAVVIPGPEDASDPDDPANKSTKAKADMKFTSTKKG